MRGRSAREAKRRRSRSSDFFVIAGVSGSCMRRSPVEASSGFDHATKPTATVISHVVLFRPKPSLSAADRAALAAALRRAVTGIPQIRRAYIGRRVLLNRTGYETQMAEHYEYSAILDFETANDLRDYLDHPAHQELGTLLFTSADAVLAYDFESISLDRL